MDKDTISIILAEDDLDDRLIFENVLKGVKLPHTLITFEDGMQLIDYLEHAENVPNVLFLDLNMPSVSGMECLKRIRKNSNLKNVCVAIYTGYGNHNTQKEALINGANIFINKTADHERLGEILTEIIYLNWQYVTDGLNRETFIASY